MAIRLPTDPRKYTDATKRAVQWLNARFPPVASLGIYNRRKIAGSSTWSQHSWGNAIDITSPSWMEKPSLYAPPSAESDPRYADHFAYLDRVAAFLRNTEELAARNVLWRRYMHRNHIHVDFYPRMTGTPPILGPIEEDEDKMQKGDKGPRVGVVQGQLIARGYELPQWGADRDFGDETEAAVKAFQADEGLEVDGILRAVDIAVLFNEDQLQLELDVDTVRVVRGVRLA